MVNIKIMNMEFSYKSSSALRGVTFEVREGEVVTLLGPNGAGKTTLLRCIARILRPTKGCVFIDEISLSKISRRILSKNVSYLPQMDETLYPLKVFEVVLLGRIPYMKIKPTPDDIKEAESIIRELGIGNLKNKKYNELSGGEQRKVAIARTLAQNPKVLLLDEPTSHLDLKHQIEIMKTLKSISKTKKISVIMSLHDINLVPRFSDKLVVLNKGEIVYCGDPKDIDIEILEKVYEIKFEVLYNNNGLFYLVPKTS
ncbi:MAG: ABC transporter ATP-binding protein [Caldisphaeraceae archaeon]|nr:ABC transporter ATP-binding protein [Caldisphaeraceae archaeon]MEB3798175.1 ABC transporter ATP-binding protein [Caldisphaeraceae archaeon]